MKCFVIYAHPNPLSFNHAIKGEVVDALKLKGHEVKVSDLYEMDFNPVLKPSDFELIYSGKIAKDVKAEQDKIAWADTIILISPIWWTGFPAILKGYIDRVFTYGFAYSVNEGGIVQLLKDKRGLLISTHGQPEEVYEPNMYKAIRETEDIGIFGFCGVKAEKHIFLAAIGQSSEETRAGYLNRVRTAVEAL